MLLSRVFRRVQYLLEGQREADDLEDEMQFHREQRARLLQEQGLAEQDAEHVARRRFGNASLIAEESREMWHWTWIEDFWKDLRYTLRSLRANLLFTSLAVLTLALGIGANTAIFSVMNTVLLRLLPVNKPHELFYLRTLPGQPDGAGNTGDSQTSFSHPVFEQLRGQRQMLSDVIAFVPAGLDKIAVRHGSNTYESLVDLVSGNLFTGLGVSAVCGRTLMPDDEKSHAAVAVISYAFWVRSFEQNCSAVGKTLSVKGVPLSIVGVASRNFTGLESKPTDVWIPLQTKRELNAWGSESDGLYSSPKWWCLRLVGRLAPGVTPSQAQATLNPAFQRAAYELIGGIPKNGARLVSLNLRQARGIGQSNDGLQQYFYVLMGLVELVLVIACANVAMLISSRNAARQREFSVRLAIGGSKFRLFRQLLAESIVLVTMGALLGSVFAVGATRALAAWAEIDGNFTPDLRVLSFTAITSILAAFFFGLVPLISISRTSAANALKSSVSTAFQDKAKRRGAIFGLALQIGLCVTLLYASGLLTRTLWNLQHIELGMQTDRLLVFGVSPPFTTDSDSSKALFYTRLLNAFRGMVGVENATLLQSRIGSGWSNNTNAIVDGKDPRSVQKSISNMMRWNAVGPNFVSTLGIPLVAGRDFNDSDSPAGAKVAIVNQTFVDKFLKKGEVLGHRVSYTRKASFLIVGVVADSKYTSIREEPIPMAYFPFTQVPEIGAMHVELRTSRNPSSLWPQIRKTLADINPDLTPLQPMTQRAQLDKSIDTERLIAKLSMCFGALAIVLVATGLYGTISYGVTRRTAELGIRMAIGAQRQQVLWMILHESLAICLAGLCLGIPLALASGYLLKSFLYGLAPRDILTVVLVSGGIFVIALAASFWPARRAASIEPMNALRYE